MASALLDVNKFLGTFLDVVNMMKDVGLLSSFAFSYVITQDVSRLVIQEQHLQILVKFLEDAKRVLDHLNSHSRMHKEGFQDIVLAFENRGSIVPESITVSAPCTQDTKRHENHFGADCNSRRYEQLKNSSRHETQYSQANQPRFVNLSEPSGCELTAHRFSPLNESQYNTNDSLSRGNHYNLTDEVNRSCYSMNSNVAHESSLSTHGAPYSLQNQMVINPHFMQTDSNCGNAFNNSTTDHVMRFPACSRESSMKHFITTNDSANQETQYISHNKSHDFSSKPSCEFAQHTETRDSHFTSPRRHFSPTNESNCDTLYTSRCDTTQEAHFSCDTTFETSNHSTHGLHPSSVQFPTPGDGSHNPHYRRAALTSDNYQSQGKSQSTFSISNSLSTPQYPPCQEPSKTQFSSSETNQPKLHYPPGSDLCETRFPQMSNASNYVTTSNETCRTDLTQRTEEATGSRYVSSFKWGGLTDTDDSFDPSSSPQHNSQSVHNAEFSDLQMVLSSELERNGIVSDVKRDAVQKQNDSTLSSMGDSFAALRTTNGVVSDDKTDQKLAMLDTAKSDGGKWKCPLCSRSFITRTNLERHYRIHLGEKPFPCSHCSKGFSSKVRLDSHLVRQHNMKKEAATPCPICSKLFITRSALETHRLTHVDDDQKPFACNICNKRFGQKVVLDAHILRHAGPNAYKFRCEMCSKTFPTRAKLKFHWRVHGSAQLPCDQCPKRFANQMLLRVHQATHTDVSQRPHRCTECPKTFTSNYKLQQHAETHGQANQYSCSQCHAEFRCRSTLVSHVRSHHMESSRIHSCPVPDCPEANSGFSTTKQLDQHLITHGLAPSRSHKCPTCPKVFSRRSNLREHERACHLDLPEEEARPHACGLCPKRFKQKSKLKAHMTTHTQEPECACSTCGKRFYRVDLLRTHEATHTGNKPFTCDVCARRFVSRSMLRSHQISHQPQPESATEVSCPSCDKKFKNKRTLALHSKSHAESLEFTCGTCGKQFARRVHFEGHMRTHSAVRPYSCTVCGRTFRERKHRVDHMRRLHPNEVLGGGELTLQGLIDSITAEDDLDTSATGGSFENVVNSDPLASLAQLSSTGMQHLLNEHSQPNSQPHDAQVDDTNQVSEVNHLNQTFGTQSQTVALEGGSDKTNQSDQVNHITQSFNTQSQNLSGVDNRMSHPFRSQRQNISLDQVETNSSSQVNHMNQTFSSQSQTLTLLQSSFHHLKSSESVSSLQNLTQQNFSCSETEALGSLPELSDLVASATSHGHNLQPIDTHSCSQSNISSHFSIDSMTHPKEHNNCAHSEVTDKVGSEVGGSLSPKLSEMLRLSI